MNSRASGQKVMEKSWTSHERAICKSCTSYDQVETNKSLASSKQVMNMS